MLVLSSVVMLFAGNYYSSSKVTLYKNGKIVRIAWFEGAKYTSYDECLSNKPEDNAKYKVKEIKLNEFPKDSVVFNSAVCLTTSELDYLVNSAKLENSKMD